MSAPSQAALAQACISLSQIDPALARAYQEGGRPTWRSAEPGYAMLAQMIAYQLLSTKAAATIWGRVTDQFGQDMEPDVILATNPERLRVCGLSGAKIRSLQAIAEALVAGQLDFDRLSTVSLSDARKELIALRGIGPWTAELFLLYTRGALDAFPPGDVGMMQAHFELGGYDARMDAKAFAIHAQAWRPYRGVAAHLLWGWINHKRGLAETA